MMMFFLNDNRSTTRINYMIYFLFFRLVEAPYLFDEVIACCYEIMLGVVTQKKSKR